MESRLVAGKEPGVRRATCGDFSRTSAGVRRCRSIWRRPEKQRWDKKMLTDMNGEPWNPTGHHQDRPPQVRGVYITLERQIKYGCTKGCAACFGDAKDIHRNAGHDSRTLWTMKQHRQQLQAQVNQTLRCGNRQRVAPRSVRAVAQPRWRADPPEDANMEPAESSAQTHYQGRVQSSCCCTNDVRLGEPWVRDSVSRRGFCLVWFCSSVGSRSSADGTFRHKDPATNWTDSVWWRGD